MIEGFHSIREICTEVDKKNFVNEDRKIKVKDDVKENITQSLERMEQTTDDKTVVEILIKMMKAKQIEVRVIQKKNFMQRHTSSNQKTLVFHKEWGLLVQAIFPLQEFHKTVS